MEAYNVVVLMEKDKETGFLGNTIDSYTVLNGIEYIENIYLIEEEDAHFIYLTLTTKDVEEWEYYGIYDLYDEEIFSLSDVEVLDGSGEYNPRWIIKMPYKNERPVVEEKINQLLAIHLQELDRISPLVAQDKEKYIKEIEQE